jgi:protein-tyrosine phosphatase
MGLQSSVAGSAIEQVRCLPLTGAVNFRDLGGYVGADGRRVRWNQLFRSDSLAELSDADLQVLAKVGLRTICDLRGEPERAHKPNRALLTPPAMHAIGFMPHGGDDLLKETRLGLIGIAEIESRVREIYRRFVVDQSPAYARLLSLIQGDALPLLFHCTSGRDRTGFATAVVLRVLGVPRAAVEEDYALSNRYRRDLTFQVGGEVSTEVMATLTQAHPTYLAAAFAAIDEHYGSDINYLREGLGVSATRQRELQNLLLEP